MTRTSARARRGHAMVHDPGAVVVVGASLGGLRTAEALRKLGYRGALALVGEEAHLPYDRPPLSKEVLRGERELDDVLFRPAAHFIAQAIDVHLEDPAVQLDTDRRVVALRSGRELPYDRAVIATGARPRMLPDAGDIQGVHVMRTLDDAADIRRRFETDAEHVVVVGAGFIGGEVASSARARGLAVTVVEAVEQPLATAVGVQIGGHCAALHHLYGTELRCGVGVTALEAGPRGPRVRLADGDVIDASLVVVGIGVVPNVEWLAGSAVDVDGAVVCDPHLRTSSPDVYALGDVASWHNPLFDRRMRVEHWTNTVEQAVVVARNVLGSGPPAPYAGVPYFWSDQYGHRLQFTGSAEADDVAVVSGSPEGRSFLALYRRGDRLVGAFAVDQVAALMRFRQLLARGVGWDDAVRTAAELAGTAVGPAR